MCGLCMRYIVERRARYPSAGILKIRKIGQWRMAMAANRSAYSVVCTVLCLPASLFTFVVCTVL